MEKVPASAVSTSGPTRPPFGGTHPLVLALTLESAAKHLGDARALLATHSVEAAVAQIVWVQTELRNQARVARQESDRIEHEAAAKVVPAPVHRPDPHLTPTGQMPAMDPLAAGGYESQAVAQDVSRGAVRASRHRFNPARYVTADAGWAAFQWSVIGSVAVVIVLAALNAVGVL